MTHVDDATLAAAAEATARVPTDDELKSVRQLAQDLVETNQEIGELEMSLDGAKKRFKELAERTLPQQLNKLGMTSFGLDSGWSLELKPFSAVGIVKEQAVAAHDALIELGGGDLIKNTVACTFGRGEDELAGHVRWLLTLFGFQPTQERSVNFQTLNAWFREQVRQDPLFRLPADYFTCFVGQVAKLKEPKPA